jgi:predicted transcriptional regulator of viral defense system
LVLAQEEKVLALLERSNGYLTARVARENGVCNVTLQRMAGGGVIGRAARGLYISAAALPDPFFVAQYRCPKGIFSHETALFLHDLSDRTPLRLMMTIPSGWNTRLVSDGGVKFFYCAPQTMQIGAVKATTAYGLTVTVYDAERTICDCLRNVDRLDKDLVLTALKRYLKNPKNDKAKLLKYAAVFKIRDTVLKYMEVL